LATKLVEWLKKTKKIEIARRTGKRSVAERAMCGRDGMVKKVLRQVNLEGRKTAKRKTKTKNGEGWRKVIHEKHRGLWGMVVRKGQKMTIRT